MPYGRSYLLNRPLAHKVLSWIVASSGVLIGLCGLIVKGQEWIETDPNPDRWLASRFEAFGPGLLGLVFLVGTFSALRNRRRGGLLFLAAAPIVAFILVYPSTGSWFTGTNGDVYYLLPPVSAAAFLSFLFFGLFYVPLLTFRNRKRAVALLVIFAIAFTFFVVLWNGAAALLSLLAVWSAPFIVFGAFWLGTHKLGWPALFATRPRPLKRKVVSALIRCFLVAGLVVAGVFTLTAVLARPDSIGDCSGTPLFTRPLRQDHVVLTAHLIRVAHVKKVSGRWAGPWAIGWVQQQYWGLPWWMSSLVFITNGAFWEGETYFISGRRADGLLTHLLPIVDTQPCFGGAAPVANAEIYRRLIGKTLPANEVPLIGYVYRPTQVPDLVKQPSRKYDPTEIYDLILNPAIRHKPLGRTKVSITGSTGTRIVAADESGIYEVNLSPDDYRITPVDLPRGFVAVERSLKKQSFRPGAVLHLDFPLEWDGTIEGTIRDTAGNPAEVAVELQHPDGTELTSYTGSLLPPRDKSGIFRFEHLPPGGRYIVMVNPFGPYKDSPFAPIYYPAAGRPEGARILEIKPEASQVHNIDFTVHPLEERRLSVHVGWPNGHTVDDAAVLVAYEHTRYWDDLSTPAQSWTTDKNGVAEVQLFGDYRVRVVAEKFIAEKDSPPWGSPRYSSVVELETAKLPRNLNLIVSSTTLAH